VHVSGRGDRGGDRRVGVGRSPKDRAGDREGGDEQPSHVPTDDARLVEPGGHRRNVLEGEEGGIVRA